MAGCNSMARVILTAAALALSIPVLAQSESNATNERAPCPRGLCDTFSRLPDDTPLPVTALSADEIFVIGATLPNPIGDAAFSIISIRPSRIGGTASGRVEDALRDVAGLTQFRRTDARSANATSQGATLRGLGGNASSRALLLLDGVPQTDPFGGWVTWPAFAPERLSSIRITRGGGSGSAGPGALAGTIEFDSIWDAQGLRALAAYGSRNAVEGSALYGAKLGGGSAFISANYARGDGFIPIERTQRGAADIAAPYEQASIAARVVAPLTQHTALHASLLAFTDRRTRGTALSGNGGDGADASVRMVHNGKWDWSALGYAQLRKFQSRFVAIDGARANVTQTVDQYNVPSTGLGARFEMRPPLGASAQLRIGGDWRRVTGQTNERFTYVAGLPTRLREAGGMSDTVGAFAELSAERGNFTLTGGARLDRWSIRDGRLVERTIGSGALLRNERPANRKGTQTTGRGGLAYAAGPFTLRSAAYIGWRLPTLNELYRPFRVGADATAANAALLPERMKGAEVGVDWQDDDDRSLRLTLFTNRLTDAIANVSLATSTGAVFPGVGFVAAGGAYRQRQNIRAIASKGIELDASLRVGEMQLSGSYAYTDAKVRSVGLAAPLNALSPAQVPRHTASATISWKGLSITPRYVAAQFEDDLNRRKLRDAFTLDTSLSFPLSKQIALNLRAENLTNTQIDAAVSATGITERASPRTFWIGLRLNAD